MRLSRPTRYPSSWLPSLHGDLKNISFQEACEILKTSQDPKNVLAEAIQLLSHLSFEFGSEFNVDSEAGILYFIAGFLARAEVKRVKCDRSHFSSLWPEDTTLKKSDIRGNLVNF